MNQNNRLYYMGDQNMVESIQSASYSMKFEKQSQSHMKIETKHQYEKNENKKIVKQNQNIFLGQEVYNSIKQRYKQIKKMDTNDAEVLYQFYLGMRKLNDQEKSKKGKLIQKQLEKSQNNAAESTKKKLLKKLQFQKCLEYDQHDIYYTLLRQNAIIKKDKQIDQQIKRKKYFLSLQDNRSEQLKKTGISYKQTVNRLYPSDLVKKNSQTQAEKLHIQNMQFVFKLINLYMDKRSNQYNPDKLYDFWLNIMDKQQLGLNKNSDQIKPLIKAYFYEQMQTLIKLHQNKKGFLCTDTNTLLDFYRKMNNQVRNKNGINIHQSSFKWYAQEYNLKQKQLENKKKSEQKKKNQKLQAQQKKLMLKTLGRPVSATPLNILAKPKMNNTQILNLAKQYPKDMTLQTLLMEKVVPHVRHAQQYGIFSKQQEIKTKNRVKIQKGKNPDKVIHNLLLKTTFQGCLSNNQDKNLIRQILSQQYLQDNQQWNKHLPALKDAIKIQSHKYKWVRQGLLGFSQKYMKQTQDFIYLDDNQIADKILKHITDVGENARKNKITIFSSEMNNAYSKYRIAQNENDHKKSKQVQQKIKEQRLFYIFLQKKAKQYVASRLNNERNSPLKQDRMTYLQKLYEQAKKEHPNYVNKHFPVIQKSLPFSHLFKYAFYKIVKDINHYDLKRDKNVKNHIWAPTGSSDEINQKTFNRMVSAYSTDKSKKRNQKVDDKQRVSVWNRKNEDERLKFLMTLQEAKQCTFKPIIHKM